MDDQNDGCHILFEGAEKNMADHWRRVETVK
jgi:hypothetical protein